MAKPALPSTRTSAPGTKARKGKPPAAGPAPSPRPLPAAKELLATLKAMGSREAKEGMKRFGITGETAETAFGIPVGEIRGLAKGIRGPARGRTDADRVRLHALALDLWETGQYEARLLACFLDEPALVSVDQMDRWAADFRDWAICDSACFHLFDKPPLCDPPGRIAFARVKAWASREEEFVRRAAFALVASLALHDKKTEDDRFAAFLPLIERHATDPRNFVRKGVSWALRGIGKRSPALRSKALVLAQRLAGMPDRTARWVGTDACRDLERG